MADINNDLKPDIMVLDILPENIRRKDNLRADIENFQMRQKAGYVDRYMHAFAN